MRILLPYWRGAPEHTFYQDFHEGLAEALRSLGHEPVRFTFQALGQAPQAEAQALLRQLDRGNFSAVFDLCCWAYGASRTSLAMQDGTKQPIFDAFGVPYAGMLYDQPYNQALNGVRAAKLHATYPDLGHAEQVRLVFPDLRLAGEIFVPPAIRPSNDRSSGNGAADRHIDVLYVGNLVPEALDRYWGNPQSVLRDDAYDARFCDALADAALAEPGRSLHLSVRAALAGLGAPPAALDFNPQLRAVEGHLRYVLRRDAVVALARSGVRMHVVGKGWDRLGLPANVEFGAPTDYDGLFRLAAQSKICLDASTYLDGANDRVFSYALNGAVCFTNADGWLRPALAGNDGVRFYSMGNLPELGDQVRALLARPDELREAGNRARQVVLASHTWRPRVESMLEALRPKRGIGTGMPPFPGTA